MGLPMACLPRSFHRMRARSRLDGRALDSSRACHGSALLAGAAAGRLPLVNSTPAFSSVGQSYACGMPVAVVLCPKLLTTEGSFASPTAVPKCPWLYARAYSLRIVSSAFRQVSRLPDGNRKPKQRASISLLPPQKNVLRQSDVLLAPAPFRLLCLNGPKTNRLRS